MIPEVLPYNNYTGDGATTQFDFDFYIEDSSQLNVEYTNENNITYTLEENIDYTINEVGNENGSYITFPIAGSTYSVLASGEVISLQLTLPISQESEYGKSTEMDFKSLEYSFDYLTRICQIISRQMDRAVKIKEGSDTMPEELLEEIDEQVLTAQTAAATATTKAQEAGNSATEAQEQAATATEQATEVAATYEEAMSAISTAQTTAITAVETAQSTAENVISEGIENIETEYATGVAAVKTEYTNDSEALQSEYASYTENLGNEYQATMKTYDRLYEGVDLEVKFADEIAEYESVYNWLEARKEAGNFEGIHIGDYFHTSISAGTVGDYSIAAQDFTCRIVGINTYKNCGDTAIGNMFYCISDEVIDTAMTWNPNANNNGTSSQANPWLASAMYAILNGVNNYTTSAYNSVAHGASCSGAGILQLLPDELQAVLKQKRNILDSRYSSSGLLTGGTAWVWTDMGYLWLPNEIEVYGCGIRSDRCLTSGFWFPEAGLSIQFPWFSNNCEHRIKKNSSGSRYAWWLSSVASYNSTYVCNVSGYGNANSYSATNSGISSPLCFCI